MAAIKASIGSLGPSGRAASLQSACHHELQAGACTQDSRQTPAQRLQLGAEPSPDWCRCRLCVSCSVCIAATYPKAGCWP